MNKKDIGILPKTFAEMIKGMPAFRNWIIHDYLPNEFDAVRLFENLQSLDNFNEFSKINGSWESRKLVAEENVAVNL